jgi:BA14K-like protein
MRRWKSVSMSKAGIAIAAATFLASLAATPACSQEQRVLRYGNTSGWSFDIRDDDRDSPSNGFFPGNFAANPSIAWIGAAGLLGSNPRRSPAPYPSQVVFGPPINGATAGQDSCRRRYRSYDPASGTFRGKDGARHPC